MLFISLPTGNWPNIIRPWKTISEFLAPCFPCNLCWGLKLRSGAGSTVLLNTSLGLCAYAGAVFVAEASDILVARLTSLKSATKPPAVLKNIEGYALCGLPLSSNGDIWTHMNYIIFLYHILICKTSSTCGPFIVRFPKQRQTCKINGIAFERCRWSMNSFVMLTSRSLDGILLMFEKFCWCVCMTTVCLCVLRVCGWSSRFTQRMRVAWPLAWCEYHCIWQLANTFIYDCLPFQPSFLSSWIMNYSFTFYL